MVFYNMHSVKEILQWWTKGNRNQELGIMYRCRMDSASNSQISLSDFLLLSVSPSI